MTCPLPINYIVSLANTLVQTQFLQGFIGGECVDPATSFVVFGQSQRQLGGHTGGGAVYNGLFQQPLGQTIVLRLHTGSLVEHSLDVVDTVANLQNLFDGPVGAGGGVQQVGVLPWSQ